MPKSSSDKQRILYICPQPFFEWRGSPIRVKANMIALGSSGFDVDLLTLPIGEDQEIENVRVIRAWNLFNSKKISIGPSGLKLWFDLILLIQGLLLISKNKYTVLHGAEEAGFICYVLSRFNRAKLVFEKHSDSYSYNPKGFLKPVLSVYRWVEKFTIKKSHVVISTGPALDEQAKEDDDNPNPEKYVVIPDTPSSIFEPKEQDITEARNSLISSSDDVLISYAGSFASYQGVDIIFKTMPEVVKKNPNAKFIIIGGSETEIEHHRTSLATQGVKDNVIFLGMVHPDKLAAYLCASDILLAPRKSGVNSPLKILDYFKAGAAIVATDTPANRRLLNDDNAVLCEFKEEAFAEAIQSLSTDNEKRKKLGENAFNLYKKKYNFTVFTQQLKSVYSKLTP